MRMAYRDVAGELYSARGQRFGGFPTGLFLQSTADLEEARPGVREEIIAEIHYNIEWTLRNFPQSFFVMTFSMTFSVITAAIAYVIALFVSLEICIALAPRGYFCYLSRLWQAIHTIYALYWGFHWWDIDLVTALVLPVFLVVDGWLRIVSALLQFVVAPYWGWRRDDPTKNFWAWVVLMVTGRWTLKILREHG